MNSILTRLLFIVKSSAKPLKEEIKPLIGHGNSENDYIKENGVWKFRQFHFDLKFDLPFEDGWVKSPVVPFVSGGSSNDPSTVFRPYPSQYVIPYHYKHRVKGKETPEEMKKTSLPFVTSLFSER